MSDIENAELIRRLTAIRGTAAQLSAEIRAVQASYNYRVPEPLGTDLAYAWEGSRDCENYTAVALAQAIEAQRATTENTGVVHDGPVPEGNAP